MDKIIFDLKNKYCINNISIINNDIDGNTSSIFDIIIKDKLYICKINKYCDIKSVNMCFCNEIYFYNYLYNKINKHIKIPLYFDSDIDNQKYIILEKIQYIEKQDIDKIYEIINKIIKMHIEYWNKDMDFLIYNNNTIDIISQIKKEQRKYLNMIYEYFDESLFLNLKNNFNETNNDFKFKNNTTFIHGSLKFDNICYQINDCETSIYFIDWTFFRKGYGIEDIIYLLLFSVNNIDFKTYYTEIIIYYFNEINKYIYYSIDDFKLNIKESLNGFILLSIFGILIVNKLKIKNCNLDFLKNYIYILSTINI